MNATEYNEKMLKVIESSDYKLLKINPCESIDRKLRVLVNKSVKNNELDKNDRFKYFTSSLKTPFVYGLIKLHKVDKPFRIIVSSKNSLKLFATL